MQRYFVLDRRGFGHPLLCSIFLPARICRKATELDVVKDRAGSPTKREALGSIPTWFIFGRDAIQRRASSSVVEHLMFPGRLFPSSSFLKER